MKRINTLLLAALLLMATALGASAQTITPKDYEPSPYVFVGVQGGVQTTFTDYDQGKLITPTAAVQVGAMFTPVVGARLHVNGLWNKGGVTGVGEYKYKYVNTNIDVMLNLRNIFCPSSTGSFFNPYLVGGVGLAYAWDNDDFTAFNAAKPVSSLAWTDDRYTHAFRVGMMFDFNLCKQVSVNLEVDANNYHDRYNSKINGRGDWQLTAMAGVNFKFGYRKAKAQPEPVIVPEPVVVPPAPEPAPVVEEVVKEPEPEPVVAPEPVKEPARTETSIYYNLGKSTVRESELGKLADFAAFMKAHPETKAELTGYADAGTGNPTINAKLAEQRVARVKKMLVEKYGIAADRIATSSKGDTVQPFSNNDDNRVVLGIAAE